MVLVVDKQYITMLLKYFSTIFCLYIDFFMYFCTSKFEVKVCANLS